MTTPTKSYRLSTEALQRLERLATYYNRSQAQQLTWLINRAHEEMETMSDTTMSDSDELKPCPLGVASRMG